MTETTSFNDAVELGESDEFKSALKIQALKWMCLGSINVRAHQAMEEANETVDAVMSTLPTSAEARQIVRVKVPEMLQNIANQQAQITDA